MRKIGYGLFFIFFFLAITLFYAFFMDKLLQNENENALIKGDIVEEDELPFFVPQPELSAEQNDTYLHEDGLHKLIGKDVDSLVQLYGEPSRVDLSAYDYEWWIYPKENSYIQVGVENDRIVTIYFIGNDLLAAPFIIGQTYEELEKMFQFREQVSFNVLNNSYQFNLSEDELSTRPLLQVDQIFIQLYFDTFTQSLSGIRYLDGKTLVKHRPYSVVYRGELIEPKQLTEQEWRQVESGSSKQILDITNEIRKRHQLGELEWDEETSIVAYQHSEDMKVNDYFSHTSPMYGELKDRLKKQGIFYQLAGENIAAKYVDSIAVVEGWLNSEGHRVNLLHEDFTHLGVGVYERYYTQNFITPW
ncbi:CAP domain-containing protein [Anaerobacillus sp. CMMVII]|uniref:CAP domain-containing protein n=1 Tax=Anaerobacillus sp. CMMVII TaxID=2755588 RepID=UPI0021B7E67D|nr:CAP domain-containing protein [Anaerobacillus sp. CMMVII]MCT8139055.1 CAP domain-containing protein [Anaerobacillus sp. CMMVII]